MDRKLLETVAAFMFNIAVTMERPEFGELACKLAPWKYRSMMGLDGKFYVVDIDLIDPSDFSLAIFFG